MTYLCICLLSEIKNKPITSIHLIYALKIRLVSIKAVQNSYRHLLGSSKFVKAVSRQFKIRIGSILPHIPPPLPSPFSPPHIPPLPSLPRASLSYFTIGNWSDLDLSLTLTDRQIHADEQTY